MWFRYSGTKLCKLFFYPLTYVDSMCARNLQFKSQPNQILHSVANGSQPLQHLHK